MEITVKTLTFTTTDGSFEGDELPTGEIIVRGETTADTFWESRFAVEACGMETITGISETGRTAEWTVEEIRDAVRGSAREFGEDSIPLSLASFLEDGPLPDWQSERLDAAWAEEMERRRGNPGPLHLWEDVRNEARKAI